MSKKKIVIISTIVLVIIIGIVLWLSIANNEASGYSYSDENITLGYVPDGMKCEKSERTENTLTVCFLDDLENYFVILICNKSVYKSIDTENGTVENIMINDSNAAFITTPNGNTLIWYVGDFVYNLYGNISKELMVRIAENVNR